MPIPSDLYADTRNVKTLDPSSEVGRMFQAYLNELNELNSKANKEENPWLTWERGLRNFYKKIMIDAFAAHSIEIPKGMEIYFAGSLAKRQATEYSDLDSFIIFEHADDKEKCAEVFEHINNLFNRIFDATNQLFPDPIGINPYRLSGTVDDFMRMLKADDEVTDKTAVINTIHASEPIFGGYVKGERLKNRLSMDAGFSHLSTAKYYYGLAINDFKAPKAQDSVVNIKRHILRPIDFILSGLRQEFDLHTPDGKTLNGGALLDELENQKLLPQDQINLLRSVYQKAMQIRYKQHGDAKKESDEIPRERCEDVLVQVQQLRELMDIRMNALNDEDISTHINKARNILQELLTIKRQNPARYATTENILNAGLGVLQAIELAGQEGSLQRRKALEIIDKTTEVASDPTETKLHEYIQLLSDIENDPNFSIGLINVMKVFLGFVCSVVGFIIGNEWIERYGEGLIEEAVAMSNIKTRVQEASEEVKTATTQHADDPMDIDEETPIQANGPRG